MTHPLAERLRNRALARLSLKKPSKLDEADAVLDNAAADQLDRLTALLRRSVEEMEPYVEFSERQCGFQGNAIWARALIDEARALLAEIEGEG